MTDTTSDEILEFWFGDIGQRDSLETHGAFWHSRMQGGMDEAINQRFGPLAEAAARGELDHWSDTPRGRLALVLVLDQFPRSLWRDTPRAYAQDIVACRLALDAIAKGDADVLAPWEAMFHVIAISHCEGPDHLARQHLVTEVQNGLLDRLPEHLAPLSDGARAQQARVTDIIDRFGRHPHRNAILSRLSTPAEEAYITTGDFPHLQGAPSP